MKTCPKCKTEKPLLDFQKDSSRKDKLHPWCRDCVNFSWRERYKNGYRETHLKKKWMGGDKNRIREYNLRKKKKWGIKLKAQQTLRNAVRAGKVIMKPCEKCGHKKVHGHHENYKKPLEVIWLCDTHHKEIHGRIVFLPLIKRKKKTT